MGYWYETDGVTQLPINHGDKVKLFILEDVTRYDNNPVYWGSGICYSGDLWRPVGLPLSGKYNYYGTIEDIKLRKEDKILIDKLSEETGISDIKNILKKIERGEFKKFGQMMVLEEVYKTMSNINHIEMASFKEGGIYKYLPIRDVIEIEIEKWYNACVEVGKMNLSKALWAGSLAPRYISNHTDTYYGMHFYQDKLLQMINEGKSFKNKEVKALLKPMIDMIVFCASMSVARKSWAPQAGRGGQHNELGIYKTLSNTVINIIDKRIKQMRKEGFSSEPDENGYYPYMLEHNEECST